MAWKFNWGVRTDHHGLPSGAYTTSPVPITESTTEYVLKNDEYPDGKTFYLGTKIYVDGGYSGGSNDGSWAHPYTTITAAISSMATGRGNRTIIVRGAHDAFDGVYTGTYSLTNYPGDDDTHRTMIVGYGQERPTLDGGDTQTSIISCQSSTYRDSYVTIQRLKLYNTQASGVRLGWDVTGDKRGNYFYCIDILFNMCGNCSHDFGTSGSCYYLNVDYGWIFHCTSEYTYGHGYKMGDGSAHELIEWSISQYIGWWEGIELVYHHAAVGIDFPADSDSKDEHDITCRYNIIHSVINYGIQCRYCNGYSIHHNELYDYCYYDQILPEAGILTPNAGKGILIYNGNTHGECYSNLLHDPHWTAEHIYIGGINSAQGNYVYNNLIYGGQFRGITIISSAGNESHTYIHNNSMYMSCPATGVTDTEGALIRTRGIQAGDDVIIRNNLLYQAGTGRVWIEYTGSASKDPEHTYNRCYAPAGTIGWTLDATDEEADPAWVENPAGEYSTNEGKLSVAIAGTDLSAYFTTDANGTLRGTWDKGWLELIAGGEGVAFETFENAELQTWVDGGGTWTYGASGSHGDSSYHRKVVGTATNVRYVEDAGASGIMYHAGWFNLLVDAMADTSTLVLVDLQTSVATSMLACCGLQLVKAGAQLTVRCRYYDGGTVYTDPVNISAATWYHYGLYYDNTNNKMAWYLSTDTDLGAARFSDDTITTTRTPVTVKLGYVSCGGTYGTGVTSMGYDSLDVDYTSLVHTAEDSSGGGGGGGSNSMSVAAMQLLGLLGR